MIKCLFKANQFDDAQPFCNEEADYIFQGKSFCKPHFLVRADQAKQKLKQNGQNETEG